MALEARKCPGELLGTVFRPKHSIFLVRILLSINARFSTCFVGRGLDAKVWALQTRRPEFESPGMSRATFILVLIGDSSFHVQVCSGNVTIPQTVS